MKILLRLSYDGQRYAGWQVQPNCWKPTLQQMLEEALEKVLLRPVRTLASGRTDAGVHALDQAVTFSTDAAIPECRWPLVLNPLLPEDMVVLSSSSVDENFHVMYDVVKKTYRYQIHLGVVPDVFQRGRCLEYRHPLDVTRMRKAADLMIGTHDFQAFCSANSSARHFVRTVQSIELNRSEDNIIIDVTGQGFLYNMVRIMVGTLLEVSERRLSLAQVTEAITSGKRELAGRTAKAAGLFLAQVEYE